MSRYLGPLVEAAIAAMPGTSILARPVGPAPAPVLAPPEADRVVEHPAPRPEPETREQGAQRPTVLQSWPVEATRAGGLTVEIIERGPRRRLAVTWTRQHRTAVEVSPHAIPELLAAIAAAGTALGSLAPSRADERDVVFDHCAAGDELVRGAWVPAARPNRRPHR